MDFETRQVTINGQQVSAFVAPASALGKADPMTGQLSCEASDLGLPPGRFPHAVVVSGAVQGQYGRTYCLADPVLVATQRVRDAEGDTQYVIYFNEARTTALIIFND